MDKSSSIFFRITPLQRRRIEQKAAEAHKTISDYARDMTLGAPIYDAELGEAYRKAFVYASGKLADDPVAEKLFAECFRNLDRYFR
jgi:hypothetical protein